MYGIDTILADEMCRQLIKDLGDNAVLSIQKKLLSRHAITLKQSMHEFEKLDNVLESIYGKACKKIERTCFENICRYSCNTLIWNIWHGFVLVIFCNGTSKNWSN